MEALPEPKPTLLETAIKIGHVLFDHHSTQEPIGRPFYHAPVLPETLWGWSSLGEYIEVEPRGA